MSSYLKYLAARCSRLIIQCIGKNSENLESHQVQFDRFTRHCRCAINCNTDKFIRRHLALVKALSSAFLMSIPRVVSFMITKSKNSSLIVKSDTAYRTNMASYGLFCVSVDSLRAKLNARKLFK